MSRKTQIVSMYLSKEEDKDVIAVCLVHEEQAAKTKYQLSWINSNERQNSLCHVLTLFAKLLATTHCSVSNTKLTSKDAKEKKVFIIYTIERNQYLSKFFFNCEV